MIEQATTGQLQKAFAALNEPDYKEFVLPLLVGERNRFASMVIESDKDDERNRGAVRGIALAIGFADLIEQELKKRS